MSAPTPRGWRVRAAAALLLASLAGAAAAQSDNPWDGFYAGLNAGGASTGTCDSWSASGTGMQAGGGAFAHGACASGGFVGGLQVGENFQARRLVFGWGADFDAWTAKGRNQSWTYTGAGAPAGTYSASGRLTPADFAILGARIGYGGLLWLPYVRGGALITGAAHQDGLSYTPPGAAKSAAEFSGGKNYDSVGWVAGGGAEWGLNGPVSLSLEYLHASLGRGSSTSAGCTGAPVTCAEFAATTLQSSHGAFSSNIIRIGVSYWFGYWNP
ncbi:MAG TPA: outer membrane beta-barrel protein [Steroidobacteraceae bacterium]|nr:outer membrane beta-barrel protein [Steroidobacteraceae bacterium]